MAPILNRIPPRPTAAQSKRFEREFFAYTRIPSVSTDPKHRTDCRKAAEFMRGGLERRGFEASIMETGPRRSSHPAVVGIYEPPGVTRKTPTVLYYMHYDVQPAGDRKLWKSGPFTPTRIKGNKVRVRGGDDDKGQSEALVFGLGHALEKNLGFNHRAVVLAEGEEEVGSPNLEPFVRKHRDLLRPDCIVICDTEQLGPRKPAITYGLKGIAYFELTVRGPNHETHSGLWGGMGRNPGTELAKIIATMTDDQGRVAVPGFYDGVIPLDPAERRAFARMPITQADLHKQSGFDRFFGEPGFTVLERRWTRPTFDTHGSRGGFQDEGAKTAIPAWRSEKFSFRLAPGQRSVEIDKLVRRHIRNVAPRGLRWNLETFHLSDPVAMDFNHPALAAGAKAMRHGFGRNPYFIREGGSIPVVTTFAQIWPDVATLLLGLGRPTDRIHSPNEEFSLVDFHRGIRMASSLPYYLDEYLQNR